MISIGLLGYNGRMGKRVAALLGSEYGKLARLHAVSGGASAPTTSTSQFSGELLDCDVVIDFSNPDAVVSFASKVVSAKKGPALVVASTGWKIDQRKTLEEASQFVPVIVSSNFSLGVLALMEILKIAAPILDSLGYNPVILETHHSHKKDSPSGTALSLQRIIAPAGPGNIQTHSVRAGEVIGDHSVSFYGSSDVIRIEHSAHDRDIFGRGAIEAALWLAGKRAKDSSFHGVISPAFFFSDFKAKQASV